MFVTQAQCRSTQSRGWKGWEDQGFGEILELPQVDTYLMHP